MNQFHSYSKACKELHAPLAVLLISSLSSISGCGGNNTVVPPAFNPAQKIAFQSSRALDGSDAANAAANVWVINADGSGGAPLTKLTTSGTSIGDPVWSPDGSKVAFDSRRALDGSDALDIGTTPNIWVMNADGSGAVPLTKLTAAFNFVPAWSPDSTKLAFESSRALNGSDGPNINGTSNIWAVNADGSGATPLTQMTAFGAFSSNPVWSPDGSKVAFESNRALDGSDASISAQNIWVVNANGSGAAPLTSLNSVSSGRPRWSPDSKKLAFESSRSLDGSDANMGTVNIWVVNADGSGAAPLTRLTGAGADSSSTVWSPDGSKLAFNSRRALDGSNAANPTSTLNIWLMNADGSGAAPLTQVAVAGADNFVNGWAPDGASLAFASARSVNPLNGPGVLNIWVIHADGSGSTALTKLTAAGAFNSHPGWKP